MFKIILERNQLGNAAHQNGNEIFALDCHCRYTYSFKWVPAGGSLQLTQEGLLLSMVKENWSAILAAPLGVITNQHSFLKILKKNL